MENAFKAIYNSAMGGETPTSVMSYGTYYQYIYASDEMSQVNGSYFYKDRDVVINGEDVNFPPILISNGSYYNGSSYQCFSLSQSNQNSDGHVITANKDCSIYFVLIGAGGSGGIPIDGGVRCNTSGGGAGGSLAGVVNMKQNDILKVKIDGIKGIDTIRYMGIDKPTLGDDEVLGDGGDSILKGTMEGEDFSMTCFGGLQGRATRDVNIDLAGGESGTCTIEDLGDVDIVIQSIFANPSGGMCRYNHDDPNSYGLSSGMVTASTNPESVIVNSANIFSFAYLLPSGGGGGGGQSEEYNEFKVTKANASLYKAGVGVSGGGYGVMLNNDDSMLYRNAWLPGGGGGGAPQKSKGERFTTGLGGKGLILCIVKY